MSLQKIILTSLVLAIAIPCVSLGATKTVLLADSTYKADTLSFRTVHIFDSRGNNIIDTVYSKYRTTWSIAGVILRTFDAAGNPIRVEDKKKTPTSWTYNKINGYLYNNQGQMVVDTYYNQGTGTVIGSIARRSYGTNGKPSADSVWNGTADTLSRYSAYTYSAGSYTVTETNALTGRKTGSTVYTLDANGGVVLVTTRDSADATTGHTVTVRNTDGTAASDTSYNATAKLSYTRYTYGNIDIGVIFRAARSTISSMHPLQSADIRRSGDGTLNATFALSTPAKVNISVYDASGRLVSSIASGRYGAGNTTIQTNRVVGAGEFLVVLKAGAQKITKKVVLN